MLSICVSILVYIEPAYYLLIIYYNIFLLTEQPISKITSKMDSLTPN